MCCEEFERCEVVVKGRLLSSVSSCEVYSLVDPMERGKERNGVISADVEEEGWD